MLSVRTPESGIIEVNVLYHSLSGLASGHSGRLVHTATIRPLGCSRKMRPLAFLDPSPFMRIYPDCSSAIRLDEPFELLAPLISQVVITTVTSGAVVQSQSVC